MKTEISYVDGKRLRVECEEYGWFMCEPGDLNKQHEGVWNSRAVAFVPQPPTDTFSDGTPVTIYEKFN